MMFYALGFPRILGVPTLTKTGVGYSASREADTSMAAVGQGLSSSRPSATSTFNCLLN